MFFLHTHICLLQSLNHLWHTWPFHPSAMVRCKEKALYLQRVTLCFAGPTPENFVAARSKPASNLSFSVEKWNCHLSERNNSLSLFCQTWLLVIRVFLRKCCKKNEDSIVTEMSRVQKLIWQDLGDLRYLIKLSVTVMLCKYWKPIKIR